jgi:hypothetical protein
MTYYNAWISLVGIDELKVLAVLAVIFYFADWFVIWHDKRLPWRGLVGK